MIEINNLTTSSVDDDFLRKIAKIVLEEESTTRRLAGRKKELELSIALVGPGRIKELNKKYRKKNRATDVLTFLYDDSGLASLDAKRSGDIVICLREVKKNAKRFGSTFKEELARVLIHGILHLLGYDHEISEEKTKAMEGKQEYYLSQILNHG